MASKIIEIISGIVESLPGHLAAGGVLAGIVWKVSERIESVLTDDKKIQVALWLRGVKTKKKAETWQEALSRFVDISFGSSLVSARSFKVSALLSTAVLSVFLAMSLVLLPVSNIVKLKLYFLQWGITVPIGYLSLIVSRLFLRVLAKKVSAQRVWYAYCLATLDYARTYFTGLFAAGAVVRVQGPIIAEQLVPLVNRITFTEIMITLSGATFAAITLPAMWLPLYVASAVLVRGAHYFDFGLTWFHRVVDLEKKPIQAIGLIAGVSIALIYWAVVIFYRVLVEWWVRFSELWWQQIHGAQ